MLFGGLERPSARVWRALLEPACWSATSAFAGQLRVTAGTADETSAFLAALARVCGDATTPGAAAVTTTDQSVQPIEQGGEPAVRRTRGWSGPPASRSVLVELDLDGTGRADISTGVASTTTCSPRWRGTR